MSNKEHINKLRSHRDYHAANGGHQVVEALDAAIEALTTDECERVGLLAIAQANCAEIKDVAQQLDDFKVGVLDALKELRAQPHRPQEGIDQ